MGYDLHITRRQLWSDTDAPDIPLNEWLNYVKQDKELELVNGGDKFQNDPGFCEWIAHPTLQVPGARPWLSYEEGCIDTKNPDSATIRKMIQVAKAMTAKVQGDDGEWYTEASLAELEDYEQQNNRQPHKPWWKFW